MIWESFSLDKLYRTKDFKLTLPKYSSSINKQPLINQIEPYIDYYVLYSNIDETSFKSNEGIYLDIHLNKATCSLYHRYKTNWTYYFHYYTNGFFYLYTQIYLNGKKHFIKQFDNNINESIVYQWERYLLQLTFINEINKELFAKEMINKIDYHFKYNNYVFNALSYFDIILLSIISRSDIFPSLRVNKENNNNNTPSHKYPSIERWFEYVRGFLELDFDLIQKMYTQKEKENLFETYKMTSNQIIVQAVREQNYDLLNDMLNKNENVNSRNLKEFKTLCHWACAKADRKALDILLKFNCDLEALDFENMTPIFDGIYSGDIKFCEYLIEEKKVKLDHKEIQDRTPFYWAACTGRIDMIKYLLTKPNVDVNAASKMGRTSLSKSCWNGQVDVVKLLCKQEGILINISDNNGRYPIHNAVWGEYGGRQGKKMSGLTSTDSPQATLCLINNGADIEVIDNEGDSPFMIAASTNGIESMKILIKHGSNPNRVNNKGKTGLIQATQYGNWESVQCLLSFGKEGYFIDTNIRDNHSYRAIDYAVLYQRIICFTILFDYDKKYQSYYEMVSLSRLAIQSNSCLCFEYVFNQLTKVNSNNSIYEELIIRSLSMQNIVCFNCIFKAIPQITKDILFKKDHKNAQVIELVYACHLMSIDIAGINTEQDAISLLPEHPIDYNEIKNKKMTEVHDLFFFQERDEVQPVTMTWTPQIKKTYVDTITNILKEYLNSEGKEISDSIMKILMLNNLYVLLADKDMNSISIYYTSNSVITVSKDYHSQLFVMKQAIAQGNNYELIWKEIIDYYNSNSLLSLAIITNTGHINNTSDTNSNINNNDNSDGNFFECLIRHNDIKGAIFDRTPISKQNVFHILFSNPDYKNKFETIINIIEKEYTSKISSIPSMINECDAFSSTPFDILMKSENCSMLELYTSVIHSLLSKHSNYTNIQGIDLYTIKSFSITPIEINGSKEYKDFIYSRLKQLKLKKTIDNQNDIYAISNYLIDEEIKKKIDYCLNKINQEKIESEFFISNKDYKHKYIQTESDLIEMVKELSKEKAIGIDAEFNGYNCDVDGIVCLMQISTFNASYAIDTLALRTEINKWLKPIFDDDSIVKVFHGCDNDICWLLGNFDLYFRNIYDTGRAFLVYQNIILNKIFKLDNLPSLYYLVKFFMGVKLDKSYQTSDWRIRPLTNNMLQYGYNDSKSVLYLYYIFQGLYLWLIKDSFILNNTNHLAYYQNMKPKFAKDREVLSKIPNDLPIDETKLLLIRIAYKCYELIKTKLRDSYIHLKITLKEN